MDENQELDETQENSSETEEETEETPREENPQKSKYDPWQTQTHERLKKVEEAVRGKSTKQALPDVDAMLEVISSTKDLDSTEIEELRLRAKFKGISLTKAREDENFKLWREARQLKVEEEKTIPPSRKQNTSEKKVSFENASEEEQEEFLLKHGLIRPEVASTKR
jgi:hypothetical protein